MRANAQSLQIVEVLAIELEPPLVLDGSNSVSAAMQAMRDRRLGYALITDADKLVGIFTERDVLLSVLEEDEVLQQPVSKLMAPEPVCVHAGEKKGDRKKGTDLFLIFSSHKQICPLWYAPFSIKPPGPQ